MKVEMKFKGDEKTSELKEENVKVLDRLKSHSRTFIGKKVPDFENINLILRKKYYAMQAEKQLSRASC